MNQTKPTYDRIQPSIIYEDKIQCKKDQKQYIGCLARFFYSDGFQRTTLHLFENKTPKSSCLSFELHDYERVESCVEQKKETAWKLPSLSRTTYAFQLIPRHKEKVQIFVCETEEHRNKWMEKLSESIANFETLENYAYDPESQVDEVEEEKPVLRKPAPPVPNRTKPVMDNRMEIKKESANLNYVTVNSKKSSLCIDDLFYAGTFDELHKIFMQIDKPGVFAVMEKANPEYDCKLAIRVYENQHSPISSWNIYHNHQMNEYHLVENGPTFANIVDLCSHYMKNDLPSKSSTINRLIAPYKFHFH
ncbi:unnamed protein product [Adineta ricciae]|uniref:PH domain-containing protein n=1 Tax=Adineta ricciae TaxID=249248 RepID=A0A815ZDZ9_ADIRI|nr:unnamed protein product [Adineta ricciae]CAF1582035.1 unnamed protein product [Adineta ricciae]